MKFRVPDLNLLLVLDAMLREHSVTGTARSLGISQPMVSQSLAKLRAFYGNPLFNRSRDGMVPTALADALREPLRDVMATIEREVMPVARPDPKQSRRTFTICTSDAGELCFLSTLVREVARQAPGIVLRTVTLDQIALREGLATGRVDLALGCFPDLIGASTLSEPLTKDVFVCLARQRQPLIGRRLTLNAFLACDHAVVSSRTRARGIFETAIRSLGLELRVRVRLEHFLGLGALLGETDLVATVPRSVAHAVSAGQRLRVMKPPFMIGDIHLAQHWHCLRDADPELLWLRQIVRACLARKGDGEPDRRGEGPTP